MKKFVIVIIGLILFFVCGCEMPNTNEFTYEIGEDTYVALGNGRFQISDVYNTFSLDDYGCFETIVDQIEKYVISDGKLYIIGYYSNDSATYCSDGTFYHSNGWHIDPKTCETIYGFGTDNIPKYLIFNYETLEMATYTNIEDVSKEDMEIFESECAWGSKIFKKICYEPKIDTSSCYFDE